MKLVRVSKGEKHRRCGLGNNTYVVLIGHWPIVAATALRRNPAPQAPTSGGPLPTLMSLRDGQDFAIWRSFEGKLRG